MTKFRHEAPSDIDRGQAKIVYYVILGFSFLWLSLILLAPLLANSGGFPEKISSYIYLFFSKVCHQQDERSFHFFEHRLGVCSRCVWIYAGFLAGCIIYPLKYKLTNVSPPSLIFLVIALAFLLLDVILDSFGVLTNTFLTRSVTGFLIGAVLPLYIIPGFIKFFDEVNSFLRNKVNA